MNVDRNHSSIILISDYVNSTTSVEIDATLWHVGLGDYMFLNLFGVWGFTDMNSVLAKLQVSISKDSNVLCEQTDKQTDRQMYQVMFICTQSLDHTRTRTHMRSYKRTYSQSGMDSRKRAFAHVHSRTCRRARAGGHPGPTDALAHN